MEEEKELEKLIKLRDEVVSEAKNGSDPVLKFRAILIEQRKVIRSQSENFKTLRDLEHSGRIDKIDGHRKMSEKYRQELYEATEPDSVFPVRIDGYELTKGRPPPPPPSAQFSLPYESM